MIKLNEKERKVIELMAQDHTRLQMATLLATNIKYVYKMVSGIYNKAGVRSEGALVAWAFRNGLLEK